MDKEKMVTLKANVGRLDYVSLSDIKLKYNVNSEEAQEMLDELIQSGLVEPFSYDGSHFKVKH